MPGMTDFASADLPLEIDRVHGSRPSAGEIRLVLGGTWRGDGGAPRQDVLLVVQVEGRRHRFPAERDQRSIVAAPGRWQATFAVPDWAQPRQEGQAAVWIGDSVVPVPPLRGFHQAPPALACAVPAPSSPLSPSASPRLTTESQPEVESEPVASQPLTEGQADPVAGAASAPRAERGFVLAAAETPRGGPLADLLLKETIAALRTELEQRTADAARLRGALSDARGELEARHSTQSELETTLGELGAELKRLMSAVAEQRAELDAQTARAEEERTQAEQRLSDLAAAHEQQVAQINEAHEQRLASLTAAHEERLAAETEGRAAELTHVREALAASQVAREAAFSEVAGLQAEMGRIGAELAVTRERVSSESGDLGEANRLLADAKALADELRRGRNVG